MKGVFIPHATWQHSAPNDILSRQSSIWAVTAVADPDPHRTEETLTVGKWRVNEGYGVTASIPSQGSERKLWQMWGLGSEGGKGISPSGLFHASILILLSFF